MDKNPLPQVCFYFQVHQPYRLKDLRIRDMHECGLHLFDDEKNAAIFRKVAEKCYLPMNALILSLLKEYPDFRVAFSLSGTFLDQCELYGPDVLESFQKLGNTGQVEFLAETYYHSLSFLKSLPEFCEQVKQHVRTIERLFKQTPRVFRNTELVYSNTLAHTVRLMGFHGVLAEGADHLLNGRSPNHVYAPPAFRLPVDRERTIRAHRPLSHRCRSVAILLKNYRLSDDIAFRFSNKNWSEHPLSAERFTDWICSNHSDTINLFMDYETFGEHQWSDTGIFDFFASLPRFWSERGIRTRTPGDVIEQAPDVESREIFDAHNFVSWADMERDLSAWLSNTIQCAAFDALYHLEPDIKNSGDPDLLKTWRYLQTSDHLYYMCTKYWSDGDVHKYFSPYDSPYEAFRRFSHALHLLKSLIHPIPATS